MTGIKTDITFYAEEYCWDRLICLGTGQCSELQRADELVASAKGDDWLIIHTGDLLSNLYLIYDLISISSCLSQKPYHTVRFTTAMSYRLMNLGFIRSQETSICLVVYNISFITLAGKVFFLLFMYIYLTSHQKIACWNLHNRSSGSCRHPILGLHWCSEWVRSW